MTQTLTTDRDYKKRKQDAMPPADLEDTSVAKAIKPEVKCYTDDAKDQGFGFFAANSFFRAHYTSGGEAFDKQATLPLTPIEIGYRLWSSYKLMDAEENEHYQSGGTSASTTLYDGKGYLITVTLADTSAFAVVYEQSGAVLGLARLNQRIHTPTDAIEKERLLSTGVTIEEGQISLGDLRLNVSRSIGDHFTSDPAGRAIISAEASIDITHLNIILKTLKIELGQVGKIQLIATCAGFANGVVAKEQQTKKSHEDYLLEKLAAISLPGNLSEVTLAEQLTRAAIADCSRKNVSIAIQTLTHNSPTLMGMYDGHGNTDVAQHVAHHIPHVFVEQCRLSHTSYKEQAMSIYNNQHAYQRDNAEPYTSAFRLVGNIAHAKSSLFTLNRYADMALSISTHGYSKVSLPL